MGHESEDVQPADPLIILVGPYLLWYTHFPTSLSHRLLSGNRLPGGPQGWIREIQAGLGGTEEVRRGAWEESFRPTRASAASRCSCRSEGAEVQARREAAGACNRKGEKQTGNPHFCPPSKYSQPLVTSLSLMFPPPGSTSSQGPGSYVFPRTCGCSRRGSGVP